MRFALLISFLVLIGCQPDTQTDPTARFLAAQKMPRSQATGDMIPAPHNNPWGVPGLATQLDNSTDQVFFNCRIVVFGHVVARKDSFSSRYSVLNLTTGWTWYGYKVGLDPATDCFKVNGCDWSACPSDSFLAVNGLFCMPDSSSDEYFNKVPTGSALLADTTVTYRYAVLIQLNTPQRVSTIDPRKSVGLFGFTYKWSRNLFGQGFYIPTYDSSFVTPAVISRLKNIK